MFKKLLVILILVTATQMSAQNDTISNNLEGNSKKISVNAKLIQKKIMIDDLRNNDVSYLFYQKKQPLSMSYRFDLNKYLNPTAKTTNLMLLPKSHYEDENVVVIKHYAGKNTTTKSFKSTQNLGTIESNTAFIRIEYKDFGLVDGDRVRVFLNEKEIDSNVHLDGLYYTLHIKLDKKGYNKIDIQAINQGYVGPNTAEFIVYDDQGNVIAHKAWNLLKGQIATLGIIKF